MMKDNYSLQELLEIMALLRSEKGCPWDREQTHESLKRYMIEETYEVLEQIDRKDTAKMCDELGDLLLQVVFHAQISKESGGFDMTDIISGICRKLVSRHPHVFGEVQADTSEKVLEKLGRNKEARKRH